MLSAHPAVPLSQIKVDPDNRRLSLHTASGHVFSTIHDGLPSPGNLTPLSETPAAGSPGLEPYHLYSDSGDDHSGPGTGSHTPGDGYDHTNARQHMNHAGGPKQEELSRRMRMVDLSRLEAERQERGEDSDREARENGLAAGSGFDSPETPVGGENGEMRGRNSRSNSERAVLVSERKRNQKYSNDISEVRFLCFEPYSERPTTRSGSHTTSSSRRVADHPCNTNRGNTTRFAFP
jgi:hypothetical protein